MRKSIFLLSFLGFATGVLAQRNYFSGVQMGINLGGNMSTIIPEHNYGYSLHAYKAPVIAPAGGLTAFFSWNDTYGLQMELNYGIAGQIFAADFRGGADYSEKLVSLGYVQLPFLYKHIFPLDYYSDIAPRFYLLGGLQTGFLINPQVTWTRNGVEETFLQANEYNRFLEELTELDPQTDAELFVPIDFSLIAGLGFEFPLENNMVLTVDGRTSLGLNDMNAPNYRFPHPEYGYRKSRNYAMGLRFGLLYFL